MLHLKILFKYFSMLYIHTDANSIGTERYIISELLTLVLVSFSEAFYHLTKCKFFSFLKFKPESRYCIEFLMILGCIYASRLCVTRSGSAHT